MLMKYEFRRAFGLAFGLSILIGILSGISGVAAYYYDTQWNAPAEISCYDAWLYCLSVSEGSFYRVIFPLLICIPYLPTLYSDRKSSFIFSITIRMPYSRYILTKIIVGIISSTLVVLCTLIFWLDLCLFLFPANLPITEVNYLPKGVFSQMFINEPNVYIAHIILMNVISGILFYLFSMAISFIVPKKHFVIVAPFAIYLFFALVSQVKFLSILNPIVFIAPLEVPRATLEQIIVRWVILAFASCACIYSFYRKDNREIL